MQTMSAIDIKHKRRSQLTLWMGLDAGNVSNRNWAQDSLTTHSLYEIGCRLCHRNQAQEALTTHILDGIGCRQCQQSKLSTRGAHNSQPEWNLMQAMSAINFSTDNPPYYLLITSCTQYSDITLLLIQFIPFSPLTLLIR
jgi:hypothetical protein